MSTQTFTKDDLFLFHQATKIPFCVFNISQDLYRYPIIENMDCSPHTMHQFSEKLAKLPSDHHFPLLTSSGPCFLAVLKLDADTNVMFGPVSSMPLTYKEFCQYNKTIEDLNDLSHLYHIIQRSPLLSLEQFASNLSLFVKLTFQQTITAEEILSNGIVHTQSPAILSKNNTLEDPHEIVRQAISFQKTILSYIKNGKENDIIHAFNHTNYFNHLQNIPITIEELQKIYFSYTLVCCIAVIENGLDSNRAFSIFDSYIARISSIHTPTDLVNLCKQLSLDYCGQMLPFHDSVTSSSIVRACLQYVQNHIQSHITMSDLADYCHVSSRTITRHFAQYYHMTASEYIMDSKLQESIFLLLHSSMTLAEISHILAFSSQSHFTVAFRKKYGDTPQQYRDKQRSKAFFSTK